MPMPAPAREGLWSAATGRRFGFQRSGETAEAPDPQATGHRALAIGEPRAKAALRNGTFAVDALARRQSLSHGTLFQMGSSTSLRLLKELPDGLVPYPDDYYWDWSFCLAHLRPVLAFAAGLAAR